MARRNRLADRIPEAVLARAEKAGLKEPDWYAGRLQGEDDRQHASYAEPPSPEHEGELKRSIAEAQRRRDVRRTESSLKRRDGVRRLVRRIMRRPRLQR